MADELVVALGADISSLKKSMSEVKSTVSKTTSGVAGNFDGVGGIISKSASTIKSALGPVGVAVAGAFAVDKITDFGKVIVESAANAQVVESQFNTAFKGVAAEGSSMLNSLSGKFSILPERLKPAMAQFNAYFKGGGATAQEALSMTEKSMNIAANGAAYYDKSLEDVQGSLKSFMMGNYEAGDAIGVSTNKTKIAEAYNKKYGGSFDDLSESQQQNYLLEYVEGIYTLSGAMEQGVKEADGYENVLGNLKQAWTNFMAVLGKPLLQITIQVMKVLVKVLTSATEGVQKLFDTLGSGGSFMDSITNKFKSLKETISELFSEDIANSNFAGIGETLGGLLPQILSILLGGIPRLVSMGIQWISSLSEGIGMSVPDMISAAIDLLAGFIVGFIEGLPKVIETGFGIVEGLMSGVSNAIPVLIGVFKSILGTLIGTISENLPRLLEAGVSILNVILEGILSILPLWINNISNLISTVVGVIVEMLPILLEVGQSILSKIIEGVLEVLPKLLQAFMSIIQKVIGIITENLPMILGLGIELLKALIDGIMSQLSFLLDTIIKILDVLIDLIVDNLPMVLDAGISILMALIDGILKVLPKLLDMFVVLLNKVADVILKNLPKILDMGIKLLLSLIDGIVAVLPELLDAIIMIIMTLIDIISKQLPEIVDAGIKILLALLEGILAVLPQLLKSIFLIIGEVIKAFLSIDWGKIGVEIIMGILSGLMSVVGLLLKAIVDISKLLFDTMKSFFDIASPSKLMRDAIGKFIPMGIAVGIEKESDAPVDELDSMNNKMFRKLSMQPALNTALSLNTKAIPKLDSNSGNGSDSNSRGDIYITGDFTVREEADIKKIAKELLELQKEQERLNGILTV